MTPIAKPQFQKITTTILLALSFLHTKAQNEYFVTVDQQTGDFNKIKMFHDVNWIEPYDIAYDQANHRYLFCGGRTTKNWQLYSVDANTGNVLDSPVFLNFSDPLDNIYSLAYSDVNNLLYGLHWSDSAKKEYFISINPVTGVYTIVNELTGVHYIEPQSTIDKINGYYFFFGTDSIGWHYYSIDLSSGNIIHSPLSINGISQMEYDEQEQKIYGLYYQADSGIFFVSTDPATANLTRIASIPNIKYIEGGANYYAYDAANHHYIFVGLDSNNNDYLLTLNSINGQILYKTSFSYVSQDSDNVVCFQYDNALNKLYAIHWESHTVTPPSNSKMYVYLNPFTTETNILFKNTYANIEVVLFTEDGKLVSKQSFSNTNQVTLNRNNLACANYYASVFADNAHIGNIKLVAK